MEDANTFGLGTDLTIVAVVALVVLVATILGVFVIDYLLHRRWAFGVLQTRASVTISAPLAALLRTLVFRLTLAICS